MNQPATTEARRVNGICVSSIFQTIDAFKSDASLANAQFRVRNLWLDGGHTRSIVKDFYAAGNEQTSRSTPLVSDTDLPAAFKGGDSAPSPLEQMLIALSSCMTTTIVTQAALRDVHIDSIEVQASGDIDLRGFLGVYKRLRRGFRRIRLDINLSAAAAPNELDELVKLGMRNSPVFWTVSNGTPIDVMRDGMAIPD